MADASWIELDRRWTTAAGSTSGWALGESRLYMAYYSADVGNVDLEAETRRFLPTTTAGETPGLNRATAAGVLTVWETEDSPDDRYLRRIVAVAPARQWASADAWGWSRGDADLPPAALYFLHCAKMRYQLRVYDRRRGPADLQTRTDAAVSNAMAVLSSDAQNPTRGPRPFRADGMLAARGVLSDLVTGSAGLIASRSRLREMRASVDIAAANMAAVLGTWTPATRISGLFADDREVADWFSRQLADDLVYLDAICDRAQEAARALGFVIENALQDRREELQRRDEAVQRRHDRVNLRQTAILGAILMILTAITAFGYKVSLPGDVVAAVIAVLGALALVLATVALWIDGTNEPPTWTAPVVAGFLGAAIGWLGTTAVYQGVASRASPHELTLEIATVSFAGAAGIARGLAVRRHRSARPGE